MALNGNVYTNWFLYRGEEVFFRLVIDQEDDTLFIDSAERSAPDG